MPRRIRLGRYLPDCERLQRLRLKRGLIARHMRLRSIRTPTRWCAISRPPLPPVSHYLFALQFTDSTSYQALFYFLVIKPSITLIFSISLIILFPISFLLVLPAPAFLRATRKLGIWQANVAIEGLYLAVS